LGWRTKDEYATLNLGGPIIHTEFQGKKLIAVDGRIFADAHWHTSSDILRGYMLHAFRDQMWNRELAKPANHAVARWFEHIQEMMKRQQPDELGRYSVVLEDLGTIRLGASTTF
jgi:hypothetical protein